MAYPLRNGQGAWQYRQLSNLLGGLNTTMPVDAIADNQTITLNNVQTQQGVIKSDTGYDYFGQVVVGQPQTEYEFLRSDLTTDLMLITLSTLYKWSTALLKWILVKGTASTTSTATYNSGALNIVVNSAAGFSTGDLVGVTLDNGDQLQTTITVVGTTFILASPVPIGRLILINAIILRAVALTGSLIYQVSAVIIPSHDWFIFTNGVNIVQRYNGTDCVVVPNLPSAGNTICRALAFYNTALFLLNTTEGGVVHSQRVRRSNQTDPTDWTTGTSGFDDLYDLPHEILRGEVLGPYLIIYRTYSIARGSFYGQSGLNYRYDNTSTTEGVLSTNSVVNLGDYHIFVGHANIYEYRGDFAMTPIGDNIFKNLFGINGDSNPSYQSRLSAIFVTELNELWIAYATITSTGFLNKLLRYNINKNFWFSRKFQNNINGFGSFIKQLSIVWSTLSGSWSSLTWAWASRQTQANAALILLNSADTNQVYEYDFYSILDNVTPIEYTIETKDFTIPDSAIRFDMLELNIQGTGILIEYSTNSGESWNTLATINKTKQTKVRMFKQFVCYKLRFRITGNSSDFALTWGGFSYKVESLS